MDEKLIIEKKTAQAVLNYLVTQPYNQVWQLIEAMKSMEALPPVNEPKTATLTPNK